jgi:hypothetical protein
MGIFQEGDQQWQQYYHGLEVIAQHRAETDYGDEDAPRAMTPEELASKIKQLHTNTQNANQRSNGHG